MAGKRTAKKPPRTRRNLDAREKLFVGEYLVTLNPEKAALAAGYSKSVARTKAYLWVSSSKHKPHVFEAISEAQQKRAERTEITQDRVLQEYAKLAFLDPRRFYDSSGNLIDIPSLPADVAAAISGMDIAVEKAGADDSGAPVFAQVRKIKLADKKGALDSVARHLGMFNDKIGVALNGSVSVTHELSPALSSRIDWLLNADAPE